MDRMGTRINLTDLLVLFMDPLTDFLASHNISAAQIRSTADARRRAAATEEEAEDENGNGESSAAGARSGRRSAGNDQDAAAVKRRRDEEKKLTKIKESKAFKKRKKNTEESDDEIARALMEQSSGPMPGQMENCEICDKRFTVTPYSVAGPDGGLLCSPCGREVAKERQGAIKKKPKKQPGGVGGVGRRRAIQSRILDGDVGTKSLATLCVQTLSKNVDLADSLGDLPDHLVDKIARMFSKRRLLNPETLPLFVQPGTETLHIYDGAKLGEQDYFSIFQTAPKLRHLKIRCGIQFKDEVMDYLLSRDTALETFYLHGANLLSEDKWHEFMQAKGQTLKGLQVSYTDNHFGDESIAALRDHCPNLKRLKVEHNQKLTNDGVKTIAELAGLEHLGLQLLHTTRSDAYIKVVSSIGTKLQTLSLKVVPEVDDGVLRAIHDHCRSLTKLRITDSEKMTDDGFVDLFTNWANPPLHFIDLQKCRQVDASKPRENPDNIGLCSKGFKALMVHSGHKLRHLNIHACRHISREAFEEVFHQGAVYPELKKAEISFCEEVTDFILGSIFRACPNIREVNVFGCMKVKSVRVPRGVILVGVPNAQGMVVEGTDY
ncbi:nucleotide exsicion repair protein rad7 [Fusarium avenaceum]|nr:nucleotide exsicion repair protein rad7 [Fusarium avenaceum]